jgi:hypothetical protein
MLIKGEKVDFWVRNMINTLRRLYPIHHNMMAVWNHFKEQFKARFIDSIRELWARNQLKKLEFQYPSINEYIAEFKDFIV